jgi:hypothetical protein
MIDVNKITSTLAKLPDQQLQQYAQMHKSDPYIMALAMSESNRRKEMRAAGQGGQGMQEQPKVVDSEIAQMAPQQMPEDMGIGQLPAGEMNFAGGGIIAFADGGDVERYQVGGLMKAGPDFIRFLRNMGVDYMDFVASPAADKAALSDMFEQSKLGSPSTTPAQTPVKAAAPVKPNPSTIRPLNPAGLAGYGLGLYSGNLNTGEDAELARRRAMGPTVDAQSTPPSPQDMAQFDAASNLYMTERAAKQAAAAAPKVDADTERKVPRAAGPTAAAPAGSTPSNQFDVAAMMKTALGEAEKKTDPFEARQKAINTAKETQAKEYVTGLEAIQKQFADIYKGKRDRLDTREGEIGKMKDQGLGLALLQAGASIMSTRGSIGQAIGAGIDTGSKQYISSLDKINSAKDKLSDARDRLDELEAQRGELSARELHKARNEVKNITTAGMEDLVKAAMAERKMNRTEAIAFVTAQLNANLEVYKQDQQTKRSDKSNAAMAAGRPYDIQGELAKAILAGDKPRADKLKEVLTTVGEARKPGLDMELVKKFENLPGVKNMQIMLNGLRMQTDPNPKTLERIRQLEGQLAATATQNGIDPAKIGVTGSASASPTGGRSINFNDIP